MAAFKSKSIAYKIFFLSLGLVLSLIVSELIADHYLKKTKINSKTEYLAKKIKSYHIPNIYAPDSDIGIGYRPKAVDRVVTSEFDVVYYINAHGLREKELDKEKLNKDEFRIIALGESNTFGEGINYGKRFTELIKQSLNNVEIINMARQASGLDQGLLMLERDGFKFNPDRGIIFINYVFLERCNFISFVSQLKPRFRLNKNQDDLILRDLQFTKINLESNSIPGKNNCFVRRKDAAESGPQLKSSKLLTLIDCYLTRKKIDHCLKEKDKVYWKHIFGNVKKERVTSQEEYTKGDFEKLIFLLFKKFKQVCNQHRTDLLIVNIDRWSDDYLARACKELNISYLDLSHILIKASSFKPLCFEIDPHYNTFTHRVIGENVSKYLRDKYELSKNRIEI